MDEGLLRGVFRSLRGREHAKAEVVERTLVALNKDVERGEVPVPAAADQVGLVVVFLQIRPILTGEWPATGQRFRNNSGMRLALDGEVGLL